MVASERDWRSASSSREILRVFGRFRRMRPPVGKPSRERRSSASRLPHRYITIESRRSGIDKEILEKQKIRDILADENAGSFRFSFWIIKFLVGQRHQNSLNNPGMNLKNPEYNINIDIRKIFALSRKYYQDGGSSNGRK